MKKLLQILMLFGFAVPGICMDAEGVKVQIREGLPIVDGVYVNGHGPYRFLVDTGATLNHLDSRLAKSIGLTETIHTTLTSSVGITPVSGGNGIGIALGTVRVENQTFLFAGVDTIQKSSPDVQGVLGQEFLSHFDYFIDMRGKQLQFGQRLSDGKGTQISYKLDHGRPVVSTSLGCLVLDSGIHGLVRFGVKASESTFELRTMSGTAQLGTVYSTLTIAGHVFWRGDAMTLPRSAEAGPDGLLPTSLFKSIYVSNSHGFIIFE